MTAQVRAWLPAGHLNAQRIEHALTDPVGQWSTRYLLGVACTAAVRTERRITTEKESVRVERSPVRIILTESGKRQLLSAALGDASSDRDMTEEDHALLDNFARELLDLLAQDIALLFQPTPQRSAEAQIDLLLAEQPCATIFIPHDALITLVKAQISSRDSRSSVTPCATALSGVPITLSAMLGAVQLTVEDVENLAAGDILILDRRVAQGVSLHVAPNNAVVAHGELTTNEGRNLLALKSS